MAWVVHLILVSLLAVAIYYLWTGVLSGSSEEDGAVRQDPEVDMDALQLISSKGYPAEAHYVTTSDGYILQMHRIPHGKNMSANESRPVVFLQHGLIASSTNWLTNLENQSFGYILADHGFDVWMGNIRGNTYSRNHTQLNPDEEEFWNFTSDQHALIDLPYMLNKALAVSGQEQLYYVGHSQGTVMGFAGFTVNQELAKKVKAFFALAPVATVQDIRGLFAIVADKYEEIALLYDVLGEGEFVPNNELVDWLAKYVCTAEMELEELCGNILFLISGFNKANLNSTRLPVYYTHTPAGTSVKNFVHFSQSVKSGAFGMYDYMNPEENAKAYNGMTHPPAYNVSELAVPTALYTGGQDWLANPTDVARLTPLIRNVTFHHKHIDTYNHLDFIWGINAANDIYLEIIGIIKEMN